MVSKKNSALSDPVFSFTAVLAQLQIRCKKNKWCTVTLQNMFLSRDERGSQQDRESESYVDKA